jgi:5-methylcytosine-specific restriction endonuclease McrA
MLCPVCLFNCKAGPIYHKHVNSLMVVCPMSGQTAFVWDEPSTREAVAGRSNGMCEFCGQAMATEMHHRLARSLGGGWSPANIIHLCWKCHRRCTSPSGDQRVWAQRVGLLLQSTEDPSRVPVTRIAQLWLSDDVAPPIKVARIDHKRRKR